MSENSPHRLAIITTHPIQYYAPSFQYLHASGQVQLKVFYTWGEDSVRKFDPDFGRVVEWDLPLLEGYDFAFLKNTAAQPGSHHFKGIVNPGAIAAINDFNPDAILVYGWAWSSHLKIIRHYAGKKPVWFRGDSTLMDRRGGIKNLLRSLFLRWLYRHVDSAFYVGTRNKDYFEKFGLSAQQLVWAPHAIDNTRFAVPQGDKAWQVREQLRIPLDATVVLFAGKLESKKDPVTLLKAFEAAGIEDCFLLLAGNGVLQAELKTLSESSPAKDSIRFLDFQNQGDMPALYQSCDLFCLPSVGPGETWGLAVNEAMAAGKAVLVSDKVGCGADLVQPGVNGDTFRAGNVADLANKLSGLTADRAHLAQMGETSRRIIENWSFQTQTAAILGRLNNPS